MISIKDIKEITEEPISIFHEREIAFEKYLMLPIPEKEVDWKFTDASKLIPEKIILGDQIIRMHLTEEIKKKNIIWCDMKTALKDYLPLLEKHLTFQTSDKFSALCSAFWNDGLFIYIPKDIAVSSSLINEFILSDLGSVFNKIVIILDEGASASVYDKHSSGKGDFFRIENIEVFLMPGSSLNYYRLAGWQDDTKNVSDIKINMMKDSKVNIILGNSGGNLNRTKLDVFFDGEGSNAKIYGLIYGKNNQHIDLATNAFHKARATSCDILVKCVLDESSNSVYRGKIKIEKEAQQTNSYLADHTLVLSENASSNSIPSLEIDANDVKASHGATQGKPDEEEIFYLMARGLSRLESEKLIISGFFSEILEKIKDDDIKKDFEKCFEVK